MPLHEYEIIEKMASGTFGIVFKARRVTDHKIVVLKRIPLLDLDAAQRRDAAQEIAVMRDLHHPCVVEQRDAFLYKGTDLCLILEYYDGGDMDTRMAAQREIDAYFPFEQVMLWFVQLVLGAQYLHARHVVHRDIKSHNVFVRQADGSVSLGDFGISERFDVDVASRTWAAATMGGRRGSALVAAVPPPAAAAAAAASTPLSVYAGTPNRDVGLTNVQTSPSFSSANLGHDMYGHSPNASSHRPPPLTGVPPGERGVAKLRRSSSFGIGASSPFFGSPQSPYGGGRMEAAMKGTPLYMAPEVLQGGAASPKSDVWSLGCVLYELLALRHPFESRDLATLVGRVSRGQREPLPSHYPRPIQDVINRMLHLDPAQRPTCEAVLTTPYVRAYVELWRTLRTPLDVPSSPSEVALSKQLLAWQANVRAATEQRPGDAGSVSIHHTEVERLVMPPACPPSDEREATERRSVEATRAALLQAGPSVSLCSAASFGGGGTAGGLNGGTFFYGASGRRIAGENGCVGGVPGSPGSAGIGVDALGGGGGGGGGGAASDLSSIINAVHAGAVAPTESMRPHMVYDGALQLDSPMSALLCEDSPVRATAGGARRRQQQQQQQQQGKPSQQKKKKNSAAAGGGKARSTARRAKPNKAARPSPSLSPDPSAASLSVDSATGEDLPSTAPPVPLHARPNAQQRPPLPPRTAGLAPLPPQQTRQHPPPSSSPASPPLDEEALFFKAYCNVLDMRYASVEALQEAVLQLRQRVQERMRHQRVLLDIEQLHTRHGSAPLQSMPNVLHVLATAAAASTDGDATQQQQHEQHESAVSQSGSGVSSSVVSPEDVYAHMVRQIDQGRGDRLRQEDEATTGRSTPGRARLLRDVAALAEAEAVRQRQRASQHPAGPTAAGGDGAVLLTADPAAPLRVSSTSDNAQQQRWSAYLRRRNALSEALTHVFDPASLRAVYAYYVSCPVLQRDARLVRGLVPDRTQWTALPMVEALVVLDRQLQPLLDREMSTM